MKRKMFAILLALTMLTGTGALAEAAAMAEDPVLATVNGIEITKSQVEAQIPAYLSRQYIQDASDYRTVLDELVKREVMRKKITDMGFDQFTTEEEDSFLEEANKVWDENLAYGASMLQSADTEEAKAEALKMAEEIMASQGYSRDTLLSEIRNMAAINRMNQYLVADYKPSEEEIQKVFQDYGALYQQIYENDIPRYEYETNTGGMESWYTPDGIRGIVHILLAVDENLANHYKALTARFEEQQQEPELPVEDDGNTEVSAVPQTSVAPSAEPQEPVTQEMLDAARQAILDSRKADIDMIYERLGRGEAFLDLIKEYGADPGMTVESNLENGYPVHPQFVMLDPVFTAAAFSPKMQKVGDVSDPVVGQFGIHILMYLRDIPSGLILTDSIRAEIEDYLVSVKEYEAYRVAMDGWIQQENVIYNEEAIQKAVEEASQSLDALEEGEPLQALPDVTEIP